MSDALLSPNFLFRFSVPVRYCETLKKTPEVAWTDDYLLPCFRALEGKRTFARLFAAWHETGLALAVEVVGKAQPIWCRDSRIEDSDGLQVWLDTRDTHNIHRASKFCHRFALLPSGGGARLDSPTALALAINRARESPRPAPAGSIRLARTSIATGYRLDAFFTASALTGFDPVEHPRLGFMYAVIDRELGWQTFQLGTEYPIAEDPSLWGTLELVR